LSNLASAYMRAGRVDEAVALLERAARLAPGHAEIHYNLGNALLGATTRPQKACKMPWCSRRITSERDQI
jgi:Flp pilus assembly protein TadD